MSKRDDDSQADIDIGMTTAERRRRRRRGAGLRVPSDNVPRRTNPPASDARPVPEDPSLAMSIAYSFTTETSEPVVRTAQSAEQASFHEPVAPEAMTTMIDPVPVPVEHADFESKTREMTAVDLEELGLQKMVTEVLAPEPMFTVPDASDAGDVAEVEPEMEIEVQVNASGSLGSLARLDSSEELDVEIAVEEATSIGPPPVAPLARREDARTLRPERLRTVALSDEDLEEVREVVRGGTSPSLREPAPEHAPAHENGAQHPVDWQPPVAIAGTPRAPRSAASEMWDEETPLPRPSLADAQRIDDPAKRLVIPGAGDRSNRTMPLSPVDIEIERSDESGSMPEIDIADLS